MCTVLDVPVRVSVQTKGHDPEFLGLGWIKGIADVRVAWINGEVACVSLDGEFTAHEEQELAKNGASFGTLPDQPIIVLDDGRSFPGTWCDVEYIYDDSNK